MLPPSRSHRTLPHPFLPLLILPSLPSVSPSRLRRIFSRRYAFSAAVFSRFPVAHFLPSLKTSSRPATPSQSSALRLAPHSLSFRLCLPFCRQNDATFLPPLFTFRILFHAAVLFRLCPAAPFRGSIETSLSLLELPVKPSSKRRWHTSIRSRY